jgi:hypothetical protein
MSSVPSLVMVTLMPSATALAAIRANVAAAMANGQRGA